MSAMENQNSGAVSQSSDRSQPIPEIDGDVAKLIGGPADVAGCGDGGVKVELGSGGGGIEMVKRKRGRPPKSQAKLPPAKKIKEENEEEDVCFICFDGGNLVLCDRRSCPKAYHPACIKRDAAFFESTAKWNCGWHICSICEKTARHMCYTCTYSLCKRCIKQADYVCVRGDKGFCTLCMKTVMLIENSGQGKDETVKVDFDDKTSWEYLFKVYWVYLKGKLSLTLDELIQAKNPWKGGSSIASNIPSTGVLDKVNDPKSITSETPSNHPEANEAKRRKTNESINILPKETVNTEKESDHKKEEYAAIDVHNMNLIYLKRNLMENLLEDREMFHDKVVGSIVGMKVPGSDEKHDVHYRLVQVVGTCETDLPYKVGNKSVDVMLQVLNLDKKEKLSIDSLSNEELAEGECKHLRQSMRCGPVKRFTVGEIQEKAVALQSAKFNDWMETEILRLNHLRDQASEKGHKKGLKECLEKLQLVKSPEERERRLREIPEVHSDPKMNPDYESDDAEEYFNKDNEHMKPKNGSTITNCVNNNQTTTLSLASGTVASPPSFDHGEIDVVWHYRDPSGNIQGPFSMAQLREWSTAGYFPADMKIWANREDDSVLLNDVLKKPLRLEVFRTLPIAPSAPISANLEKLSDSHASLAQSSGQNWGGSSAKLNESTTEFKTPNIPSPIPKENTPDATLVPQNTSHEEDKETLVQDTANPPSWSSASSLVLGGAQNRGVDFLKNGEMVDSGLPVGDHVATPTSNIEQIIHSSSPPCNDMPSWHGVGETIEFSTLAEESVSDLLAEVDAMESQNGFPSPTSRRNIFVEDLFGSMEEFSPTPDQGTRSDGFSSSGDIQLPCHSTTTTDEHLFGVSQGNNTNNTTNNNVFDLVKRSTGLEQQSFNSGSQRTIPGNMGFKWPENVGSGRHVSELQLLPQNMIDINISTNEGENVNTVFDPSQAMGVPAAEDGEFLQLAAAAPPMPPPPRSWTMALDAMAPAHTNSNRSVNLGWDPHEYAGAGERRNNSSDGGGSGGGGGGGGSFRQPSRGGQRVCKLYESGRCRKGASCKFMHP